LGDGEGCVDLRRGELPYIVQFYHTKKKKKPRYKKEKEGTSILMFTGSNEILHVLIN
jgi:hypothetical protein